MTRKEELLVDFLAHIRDNMCGARLAKENRIGIVFGEREELHKQADISADIVKYEDYKFEPELVVNGKTYILHEVCCADECMIPWEDDIDEFLDLYITLIEKTNIDCKLGISCKMCTCS